MWEVKTGTVRYSIVLVKKNFIFSGSHQLLLLNYYPYIARFLAPHQREVKFPPLSLVLCRQCPPFIGCPENPVNYYVNGNSLLSHWFIAASITFHWMPEKIRQNIHFKV
jgi:hypothetical protein